MTSRFKFGLTLVAALGLACLAIVLLDDRGGDGGASNDGLIGDGTDPAGRGGRDGKGLTRDGDPGNPGGGNGPVMGPGGTGGPGSLVGARTPSGADMSDPAQRLSALQKILQSPPIKWDRAGAIIALMDEPLPAEIKSLLINELKIGRRRSQMVLHVFSKLNDGSMVVDLLRLFDDPETIAGVRGAILEAIWKMPSGDDDEIARQLEGRLAGEVRTDVALLGAIARRGGPEAARAIVEYVQRMKNPSEMRAHVLRSLDVAQDKQAAAIVVEAMDRESSPKVLRALVILASQPGATHMSEAMIALDRDGLPSDLRSQVLGGLGRIGDARSTEYLLRKAQEPGHFGQQALRAIAVISSSDPKVTAQLAKALSEADSSPRPLEAKKSLLRAIGVSKDIKSLPAVARSLDDRDRGVQIAAIRAMSHMGSRAEAYVAKLTRLYDQGDGSVQMPVAVALGSIGGKEAILVMKRMLEKKDLDPSLERTLKMGLHNAQTRAAKDGS